MTGPRSTENFDGYPHRECGEHRTAGSYRAWCFDCREWCYNEPIDMDLACKGCRLGFRVTAKAKLKLTKREQRAIRMVLDPKRAELVISEINTRQGARADGYGAGYKEASEKYR